ncbi:MAG: hypothetical protein ACRC6E_08820 [Fusobacteriaceae bacterium]
MNNYSYALNPNIVKIGEIELHDGTILKRKFLAGTEDQYECKLIFITISINEGGIEVKEVKPFVIRIDNSNWVMEFLPEEYEL